MYTSNFKKSLMLVYIIYVCTTKFYSDIKMDKYRKRF